MTCRELIEFLDDYLAGDLPPESAARFHQHLAVCRSCVAYLDSYRATIALGRDAFRNNDMLPPDLPLGLLRAVLAAREARPNSITPGFRS